MKPFIILLVLSLSFSAYSQHWTITELSPMPEPVSNNAVSEGFVNGVPYVYSFAGIDATKTYSGIHNRSYRYDTQNDNWETIEALPDTLGKIAASANRVGDIIYIIGGYHVFADGSEVSSNKVHRYNTQTNSYLPDGAPIPIPIDDQVQVVKDDLIYVVSGWSNDGNVNDVQIYNTTTDEWLVGTPITFMETPVFGAAGAIQGDTIYFFGGARNGNFSIQILLRKGAINPNDPTDISWETIVTAYKGYRTAATTANGAVYFIGGADDTYNFDGLAYDGNEGVEPNNRSLVYNPNNGTLEEDVSNVLPMDLRGIANVSDSLKYLTGGMLAGQMVTDKLWRLEALALPTSTSNLVRKDITIKTFPNPVQEQLQVQIPSDFDCRNVLYSVIDQQGKILLTKEHKDCQTILLDVKMLTAGMYQLKISDGQIYSLSSFVKY